MHRYIAFAGLLFAPACLNPDISDEYPVTTEAEALDVDRNIDSDTDSDTDDGAADSEESANEEDRADEADSAGESSSDDATDDSSDDDRGRAPPRRTWLRR